MKAAPTKKPLIRIAVVESDPLRFAGFHALFDSEPDFELISASLPDIGAQQNIDLVLLGNCHNLLDVMSCLKAPRPQLRIIVTGSGMDEQTILKAIASGAKGYVDATASPADFVQAIRIVSQGSVWAPRRVLSMFIERVSSAPGRIDLIQASQSRSKSRTSSTRSLSSSVLQSEKSVSSSMPLPGYVMTL